MHDLTQYRQVRLTRLTPLDAPEVVGDIQIPTEQMTYLLNDALVHNCSFCFPVDSITNYVQTKEGRKLLSAVEQGDLLLTPSGRYSEVLKRIETGTKEVREYAMDSGEVLAVTPDHPVLIYDGTLFRIVSAQNAFDERLPIVKML